MATVATPAQYFKPKRIVLKDDPRFDEAWVRKVIVSDPEILGLGDLTVRETERRQPRAGRLDMLLENPDPEYMQRFEVELMLGKVDESHIIRCIEYWDTERRRFPRYEHMAVLIAEELTSRFLNIIQLFNRTIPMIALQLSALQVEDKIVLNFTKVLDDTLFEDEPDDADEQSVGRAPADRDYWEGRSSAQSMALIDQCLTLLRTIENTLSLNYQSQYIGLQEGNRSNNFVIFRPRRKGVLVDTKLTTFEANKERFEALNLKIVGGGRCRFDITSPDALKENEALLIDFFRAAYAETQD